MNLGQEKARNVLDAVADIGRLAVALEVFQHVGLGNRNVDAFQVKQILDIADGTIRDNRQDTQVGRVIEHFTDLCCKPNERAFEQAASQADGPFVHPLNRWAFTHEHGFRNRLRRRFTRCLSCARFHRDHEARDQS